MASLSSLDQNRALPKDDTGRVFLKLKYFPYKDHKAQGRQEHTANRSVKIGTADEGAAKGRPDKIAGKILES